LNALVFEEQWPQGRGNIYTKLEMFQSFRFSFLIYLTLPVLFLFVKLAILSWKESWIITTVDEGLILYLLASVTFSFRSRKVIRRIQQPVEGETAQNQNAQEEDEEDEDVTFDD
jgi:predicted membrane channel-forming protein YqfA (hemolysin III family)